MIHPCLRSRFRPRRWRERRVEAAHPCPPRSLNQRRNPIDDPPELRVHQECRERVVMVAEEAVGEVYTVEWDRAWGE